MEGLIVKQGSVGLKQKLITVTRQCNIQLFPERLSEKVHATILKVIVGGFEFTVLQRNLKEWIQGAMDVCLRA